MAKHTVILLADKVGTKKKFIKTGDKIVRSRRNSHPHHAPMTKEQLWGTHANGSE